MSIGEQIIDGLIASFFTIIEFTLTEIIGSLLTAFFNSILSLFGTTA